MEDSDFIFGCVNLLQQNRIINRINFQHGGSYIHSPDWIKNKKATQNIVNKKDNKCFQYATKVALNYEKNGKRPERITKIKPFIEKYNWEEIPIRRR